MNQITKILNNRKIKIFKHEESLDAARNSATSLLIDSPQSSVTAALDIYHNTLIEQIKNDISKEQVK